MKEFEALLQRLVIERTEAESDTTITEVEDFFLETFAEIQERYIARLRAEAVGPGKVMS